MKLPISWLNEFVNTNASVEEICGALVGIGFEVEDVIRYGENISGVVVGKIIDIKPHPDADKLRICEVDVGKDNLVIVTGAKNVKVGDVVPVALDGAKLPSGKMINAAPLRGIMSFGMMCSGNELGVSEAFVDGASVDGILILDNNLPIGEDIAKALELNETVLDVSITANRPDCHSILGLSRELSAALNSKAFVPHEGVHSTELKLPSVEFTLHDSLVKAPSVTVTSIDCPAYTSALITDIKIEKSPKWMQKRLFMCGINPINNIVDITNYVLLEIGQPLHAFDLSMIEGNIVVRNANEGEKITALNGEEYDLTIDMTMICDDKKPLAIAGVMGGKFSGISDGTKNVFLESARFSRGSVRSTSHKLSLRSDSSTKFERGVDYFGVEYGRKRALHLVEQLGAGKVVVDRPIENKELKIIDTTMDNINSLLGIEVPKKSMVDILANLGMDVEIDCRNLKVKIPLFREDIDNYTDLAEEVIRFYGYDKLTETFMPTASITVGGMTDKQKRLEKVKDMMCALGAYEIMTYSFTDDKVFDKLNLDKNDNRRNAIRIINPISEDLAIMKTELVSGMLATIATNLTRKNDNFRLFELAKTYDGKRLADINSEKDILCVGAVGAKEDFYAIKSIFAAVLDDFNVLFDITASAEPYLHPGMSADIISDNKVICSFGRLHPSVAKNFGIKKSDVFVGCLDCTVLKDQTPNKYRQLPKFPPVERDLALVVDENVEVGKIIKRAQEILKTTYRIEEPSDDEACILLGNTLNDMPDYSGEVELFDIYRGEQIDKGKKSVALKIKIVPLSRTLVDDEIGQFIKDIVADLGKLCGAEVRK